MGPAQEFIRTFVAAERQERYLALASNPTRRRDFILALAHDGRHLERKFMQQIPAVDAVAAKVAALLKSLGAGPRCFVVAASHGEFDNCAADTAAVLQALVGRSTDCIVFFPGAGLAYYENHEGECHVLRRPATR